MEALKNYDVTVERNVVRNLAQNISFAKEVFIYDTIRREHFTDVFFMDSFRVMRAYFRKYGILPNKTQFARLIIRYMTRVEKYSSRKQQEKYWLGSVEKIYRPMTDDERAKSESDKDILLNLYSLRQVQFAMVESEKAYSSGDVDKVVDIFSEAISNTRKTENVISDGNIIDDLGTNVQIYQARKRRDIEPLTTGIVGVTNPDSKPKIFRLDNAVSGGWYPGEFVIYVGDNNIGKSTALMETGYRNAYMGKDVLMITIEMSKEAQQMRIYSRMTGIPFSKFRSADLTDREFDTWNKAIARWRKEKRGIYHISAFEGSVTVSTVEEKMRELESLYNTKFDMLVIDYLNDMKPEGKFRSSKDWDALGDISWGLASLAKKWNNRKGIQLVTANQRKTTAFGSKSSLTDAAFSPLVTQHASVVVNITQNDVDRELGRLEWTIVKHRFARKNFSFYTYPRFDVSLISSTQRIKDELVVGGYDD